MSKPRTPLQIATAVINSKKSTGPTTEEGKAASSQNAVVHGLTSRFSVQPWESEAEYLKLYEGFAAEFPAHSELEKELLESMINSRWLVRRAIFLQEFTFDLDRPDCVDTKLLELYMRYQTRHESVFHKAHAALVKIRAERQKTRNQETARQTTKQLGFVSQQRQEAAESRKQELHEIKMQVKKATLARLERQIAPPKTAPPSPASLQTAA